jgi:hypothetical protein
VGRRKGQDLFYILGGGKVAAGGVSAGPTAANKAPSKIGATGAKPVVASKAAPGHAAKPVAAGKAVAGGHKTTDQDWSKLQAEL